MNDATLDLLNSAVKLYVGPSKIHGVGIFAIKDIPKGGKLFSDMSPRFYETSVGNLGKLMPEVRERIASHSPTLEANGCFIYPTCFYQAFMNHADDPNCDATVDVALRDIKAGEEVTEDYRLIPGWEKAFPWLVRDTI